MLSVVHAQYHLCDVFLLLSHMLHVAYAKCSFC
jgi:hypothetical protein